MFRVCVIAMIICSAKAGVIGLGSYDGHGYLAAAPVAVAPPIAVAHAPAVAVAHAPAVAVAHGATSWQNNNLLALNPTAVVTKVAAPVAIAAPVVAKVAAPVAYAPAPWALGLGKGVGFGYH